MNGNATVFADVDNLFHAHSNRFALGNPFTAIYGPQHVPLAPRTVRIGVRETF